jgi:hypothetical protein
VAVTPLPLSTPPPRAISTTGALERHLRVSLLCPRRLADVAAELDYVTAGSWVEVRDRASDMAWPIRRGRRLYHRE